jgi:hypothetical protein
MSFVEYADKSGRIYTDEDISGMSADELNNLCLHVVDEDWM